MLVSNTYSSEGHCQRVNSAFPEVLGMILRRLNDNAEFERIFGVKPRQLTHSKVFPSLRIKEITKFMTEIRSKALPKSTSNPSSLFAELSVIASDSLQRLLTTLFQPLQNVCLVDYEGESSLHAIWQVLGILQQDMARQKVRSEDMDVRCGRATSISSTSKQFC